MDEAGRKSGRAKGPWEDNEALQPGICLSFLLVESQESSTQLMKPTERVFSKTPQTRLLEIAIVLIRAEWHGLESTPARLSHPESKQCATKATSQLYVQEEIL